MTTTMVIAIINPPSSPLNGIWIGVAAPVYIGLAVGIETTVTLLMSGPPVPALLGTAETAVASSKNIGGDDDRASVD